MIFKLDLINERKSIINCINCRRVSLDLDLARLLKDLGIRNNFPLLISNSWLRKLNSNIFTFSLDILVQFGRRQFLSSAKLFQLLSCSCRTFQNFLSQFILLNVSFKVSSSFRTIYISYFFCHYLVPIYFQSTYNIHPKPFAKIIRSR